MKKYTSDEIQEFSSDFRDLAKRLLRTDYSQCNSNLIRFINYIENNELIMDFIKASNTVQYDIEVIIKSRHDWKPFKVSPIDNEEISFEYQMLKYSYDKFEGNFTRLYGLIGYISSKGSYNDHIKDFSKHIIDPFVDYISKYLTKCYNQTKQEEENNSPTKVAGNTITAHNSTVVVGSPVTGDVSNKVSITNGDFQKAIETIAQIERYVNEIIKDYQEDFSEILNEIKDDMQNQKKPKKSLLTALKSLATGTITVAPLITELIRILNVSGDGSLVHSQRELKNLL